MKAQTALPLFDLPTGLALRDAGINQAAENNGRLVIEARELAIEICKQRGSVHADDVYAAMVRRGYGHHSMGNSMAGVFRDRRFRRTDRRVKSQRPWAKGNMIYVYELI